MPENNTLLHDVKTMLGITWQAESTDARLRLLIDNGIAYLDKKRGSPADYAQPGLPRTLLFEYVRYGRDEALDVFENNYRSMILAMQNDKAVSDYVEKTEQTDGVDISAV